MSAAAGHRSVVDHRAAIAGLLGEGPVVRIALDRHAAGRRLAAELVAADDLPRFDNSAMDGYAAHPASEDQRAFVVVGDIPAGAAPGTALGPGEAARVMTGAALPPGPDRTGARPGHLLGVGAPGPPRAAPRRGGHGRLGHRPSG